jgi:hypothetical protein
MSERRDECGSVDRTAPPHVYEALCRYARVPPPHCYEGGSPSAYSSLCELWDIVDDAYARASGRGDASLAWPLGHAATLYVPLQRG